MDRFPTVWSSQPGNLGDWHDPEPPKRDWKKALLILGLGTLSWVATYVGMLELIQSNMGDLPLTHKIIVGFSVAMLMIMIIWLLDQMFAPLPFLTKFAYVAGYIFLTTISVGFGFGFYWKVLESRSEASRSAESAVTQVKTALYAASTRLDQLQTTLDQLTQISTAKAVEEREYGTSCPNSRPGDGPRRRLRDADAARFNFASQFVKSHGLQTKNQMNALDLDIKKITSADPSTIDPQTGTRNKFLQGLARRLELTATGFNAFRTDPQLRQIRSELAERAAQTQFPTSRGGTFSCPDPQLQSALRGVVRAIDQLPELGKPEIATVEGAQAVVEAFRRLATTFWGVLTFSLPPSADELRALQQRAVQSAEDNAASVQAAIPVNQGGLSKRDYIPFIIALFVDLCLLLVSIGRPMNRLHGLVPKMRAAERGPVYQILSRFDDIHRGDAEVLQKFEFFRHVVFDFHGDYYVAVPLDAPEHINTADRVRLQQEAHLLGNLFASFEKEKIFSRVYNPMLTRRVIQKKLARQGSKFAESPAFRTYRFRDGAWSEIILGAVMGAARHMPPRTQTQVYAAPSVLQTQAPGVTAMPAAEKTAANEIHSTQNDMPGQPDERSTTRSSRTMDPHKRQRLRQEYGPYGDRVAESEELNDSGVIFEPQERAADPAPVHAVGLEGQWSERHSSEPEGFAAEPQSDLANAGVLLPHQLEVQDPNNVIQMKKRQKLQPDRMQSPASSRTPADAAMMPSFPMENISTSPNAAYIAEPPVSGSDRMSEESILQPVPEQETNNNVNVRITERTADFTLPTADLGLQNTLRSAIRKIDDVEHEPYNQELSALPSTPEKYGSQLNGDVTDQMPQLFAEPQQQPVAMDGSEAGEDGEVFSKIARKFSPEKNGAE